MQPLIVVAATIAWGIDDISLRVCSVVVTGVHDLVAWFEDSVSPIEKSGDDGEDGKEREQFELEVTTPCDMHC